MSEYLPWAFGIVAIVMLVVLLRRRSSGASGEAPPQEYGADMIINKDRKRLYLAMKHHFLNEQQSEEGWRTFEFLEGLPKGSMGNRVELEKKLAARFKLSPPEARQRLALVMDAIRKVKEDSKSARG